MQLIVQIILILMNHWNCVDCTWLRKWKKLYFIDKITMISVDWWKKIIVIDCWHKLFTKIHDIKMILFVITIIVVKWCNNIDCYWLLIHTFSDRMFFKIYYVNASYQTICSNSIHLYKKIKCGLWNPKCWSKQYLGTILF